MPAYVANALLPPAATSEPWALPPPAEATVAGVQRLPATPWVVLTPAFKPSVGIALSRFCGGAAISLTASSGLLLDGDITVHSLSLDGALRISAVRGAREPPLPLAGVRGPADEGRDARPQRGVAATKAAHS